MNFYCNTCRAIISGTSRCPLCGTLSSTPSASTIQIEEVGVEGGNDRPRKRNRSPHRGAYVNDPQPPRRPPSPVVEKRLRRTSTYALLHTVGLNAPDPMGGDGAYADWMSRHFSAHTSPIGCVYAGRLVYEGSTDGKEGMVNGKLSRQFRRKFNDFLQIGSVKTAGTVVLNWHLRRTGRPNAWSGRGMTENLVKMFRGLATEAGLRFRLVYTIHESEGLAEGAPWRFTPSSLIALNPDVCGYLNTQYTPQQASLSQVPGLLGSLHTTSLDGVLRHLGPDTPLELMDIFGACLMQRLRLANGYGTNVARCANTGVVVFGMITARHGTTLENIRNLCGTIGRVGLGHGFKVIVVGKTQDSKLAKALSDLGKETTNVHLVFHGELDAGDAFNSFVGCRYAISFDPKGYRDNASAMVNVTRAGHLLFSRNSGECDAQLVRRAVMEMILCERNTGHLVTLLAQQQPRYRATDPFRVGTILDAFFRGIVISDEEASAPEAREEKSEGKSEQKEDDDDE